MEIVKIRLKLDAGVRFLLGYASWAEMATEMGSAYGLVVVVVRSKRYP